ncbi:imidazole glycerol phosphate synthase subunit HisH [Paenibacillus yanchengensis]|uniref:Imidazole glycerol phosphate synthase subunit HisH n=1 Tax=Paenibacillus yanchengensis TaxID=2035833 RepID=A0ABW4YGU3_9BACL
MIAIVDYGMGNLQSVHQAAARLGFTTVITSDADVIAAARGLIIPGVGAFGDAMSNLTSSGLDQTIRKYAASGKPVLGICLGMQLLFETSMEHGLHEGLSLLPGQVVRFSNKDHREMKIPHMGWNKLQIVQPESPLFANLAMDYVYFVHSYHVKLSHPELLLAQTDYYGAVTAIVGKENIYGMQFHPEKSGLFGLRLLQNFLSLTN